MLRSNSKILNKNTVNREFQEGDLVYVKIFEKSEAPGVNRACLPKREGPYIVIEVLEYTLVLADSVDYAEYKSGTLTLIRSRHIL